MTPRNSAIELLRILMMFGICLLHSCETGKNSLLWPKNLMCSCVVGFVFISGYFGVRFSLSKVLRLEGVALVWCALVPFIGGEAYEICFRECWSDSKWFLHAYVILLCMAPMLEQIFEKTSLRTYMSMTLPYLMVVFLWGFMVNLNCLKGVLPTSPGLISHSVMTMLGIYIVGRIYRLCNVERYFRGWRTLLIAVICALVLSGIGTYSIPYNNPLHLLFVAAVFGMVKEVRLPKWASWIVLLVAPSMFSVYILHAIIYFPGMPHGSYVFINHVRDSMVDGHMNRLLACFLTALLVFAMSLIADFIRRGVMVPFARWIGFVYSAVDRGWWRLTVLMDKRLVG